VVHQSIEGSYRETNLTNESAEYLARREELRLAEIALMEQQERVAAMRRTLPLGQVIADYEFTEGPVDLDSGDEPARQVRLSELWSAKEHPLVVYHMMYGKKQKTPCPMCTLWVDGFNGVAHHLAQNIDFVVIMAAELPALRVCAHTRMKSPAFAERGVKYFQIRSRQRRHRGSPGLYHLRICKGQGRGDATLLHGASKDVA
jgi:predicted dithiol-disulfide oxidoreductase (DUF899 family)